MLVAANTASLIQLPLDPCARSTCRRCAEGEARSGGSAGPRLVSMSVRHAVGLPNVGVFGSVPALVELAVLAEHSGWDGVHLWDHLLYHDPEWPVASPVATAAAVAAATQRVRIVLTLTLPRRQVQDVAQETAGIAALASGRLTVLGIIGSMDREFTELGAAAARQTQASLANLVTGSPEVSGTLRQQRAFALVPGESCRPSELGPGLLVATQPGQQVASHTGSRW